jgi:integrase
MIELGADPLVGDYLQVWLAHAKTRVRAKTWEGYESLIRRFSAPLASIELKELKPLHLQSLYASLLSDPKRGLSKGSVLNLHLVFTQSLAQAVRWGILAANPAAGAQPPRPRRPEVPGIDPALAARILQRMSGTRFELPAAIAISTGMRRGEILGLHWADVAQDLSTAQVKTTLQATKEGGLVFEHPKTARSRRQVLLPAFLMPYLVSQRSDQAFRADRLGPGWVGSDLVVDRGDGGPWNPDSFSSSWAARIRSSDLPKVRFHDLRHAHATLMLLQGVHPKIVSERLGHASVGITLDTYSHVIPTMQEEAAKAFDALFPASA